MIPAFETLARQIDDVFFLIGAAMLLIEIAEMAFKGTLKGRKLAEMAVSISTQIPAVLFNATLLTASYAIYWIVAEGLISWTIPLTPMTLLLAVLVADFFYYWEHRIAHRVRLLWTQHAVHHSSRDYNLATAIRFGPFEGLWAMIAHLPMVAMGFAPEVVLAASVIVLAYQTWLHTELIGRLGPLEWVLNTPSHHRVHHGADAKYLDKNYAGILIIWDRMFGSFQPEEEQPRYGLVRDFDSHNPLRVWFSELPELWTDLRQAKGMREVWMRLFAPPGWRP